MITTENKPPPFLPEPLDALKARFPLAQAVVITESVMQRAVAGLETAATTQRKHVFDFESGIRMIFTFEVTRLGRFNHFSFGIPEDSPARKDRQYALRGYFSEEAKKIAADFGAVGKATYNNFSAKAFHMFFDAEVKP
jgi:hypothetical protein